jgi:bifunctional enzyme CysN/CysC
MRWYSGPTFIEHIESMDVASSASEKPLRRPVQWVNRLNSRFLGYCGSIASGRVRPGDRLVGEPASGTVEVAGIESDSGDLEEAVAGQAVTPLTEEVDVSRGDVSAPRSRPVVAGFSAHVLGWASNPCYQGDLPLHSGTVVPAQVTELRHKINVAAVAANI